MLAVGGSRRKSMPANFSNSSVAQNRSTLDDSMNGTCFYIRKQNLSDVLHRATLLSQHQQTTSDAVLLSQVCLYSVDGWTMLLFLLMSKLLYTMTVF